MQYQSHTQRSLSQATLLILANQVDEPKTATTLHEAVVQATGLVIEPGMFSRTLAHLEQRGWIEALMTDHPLRLYRITAPGLLAFE
jgi:DNA-binding PadR family transcriptional regulator